MRIIVYRPFCDKRLIRESRLQYFYFDFDQHIVVVHLDDPVEGQYFELRIVVYAGDELVEGPDFANGRLEHVIEQPVLAPELVSEQPARELEYVIEQLVLVPAPELVPEQLAHVLEPVPGQLVLGRPALVPGPVVLG